MHADAQLQERPDDACDTGFAAVTFKGRRYDNTVTLRVCHFLRDKTSLTRLLV